ncbi:hypothetical protein HD597_000631 [Nonomuraea thailandensis]|uniref:Mutator family transposase n=1 Tax=Nonomuraea thailandensis TaxID=1188745 RepID=A0A9X2GDZ6_9ACTN|nr:hypothetical protein [Nonomuraea thailandensis]
MALDQSALLEVLSVLKNSEASERIRHAAETIYQALIEAELTAVIGAAPHERTPDRMAQRNGHRPRTLTTTAGDLELQIPKLRTGLFFPSLLERRRRVDQALFAVVMEAYLHGVSTRKVDDLVKALGADTGISKSEVSRICADLDEEVTAFRDRSLAGQTFPYLFLDATYCKARVNRRVVSQAVIVATGVSADGRREVLGFAVGDSEDGAFWTAFLRSLRPVAWPGCSWSSPTRTPAWSPPSARCCSVRPGKDAGFTGAVKKQLVGVSPVRRWPEDVPGPYVQSNPTQVQQESLPPFLSLVIVPRPGELRKSTAYFLTAPTSCATCSPVSRRSRPKWSPPPSAPSSPSPPRTWSATSWA